MSSRSQVVETQVRDVATEPVTPAAIQTSEAEHDPPDARPLEPVAPAATQTSETQHAPPEPVTPAAVQTSETEHDPPDGRPAEPATPPAAHASETRHAPLDALPEPTSAAGAFRVLLDQGKRIRVQPIENGAVATEDQRSFIDESYRQIRLIHAIVERGERDPVKRAESWSDAASHLHHASQFGLEGVRPDVPLGRLAMRSILDNVIHEHGQRVRAAYLWDLALAYGAVAIILSLLALLVSVVTHYLNVPQELVIRGPQLILLVVALSALLAGAWLSAAARLEPDSPEVLASIFSSTLNARLRAVYVLGFGFLAILLLHKQVIVFSFGANGGGGFNSAMVLGKLSAAILTGGFLGLGVALLPQAVIERSANLIAAMTAR
jgi:hypothetical protein